MSLATTCPKCRTSFKVVPDQLKLRRGQVRCGVCQHVFSGLDSLRYVQADSVPLAATPTTANTSTNADTSRTADTSTTPTTIAPPPPDIAAAASPIEIRPQTSASIDAEAQPQADPFIDIESIAPKDPSESRGAVAEPTLEVPDARIDASPTTARDESTLAQPREPAPTGRDTETLTDRDTEALPDRDTEALPDRNTEALPDRDTEALPDRDTETLSDGDTEPAADPGIRSFGGPDTETLTRSDGGAAATDNTVQRTKADARPSDEPPARNTLPLDDAGSAFDALARDLASPRAPTSPPRATVRAEPAAEGTPDDDETDAVDFFSTQRSTRGFSTRGTLLSAFASIVLAALLATQAVIGARDWLAAHYPALRPAIAAGIAPLGLEIAAPRALDSLSIEGFELQSTSVAGLYAMNALLRNGANHDVRWPAMELTLSDQAGAVIVRKVLMPADYLAGASVRSAAGTARVLAAESGAGAATPAPIAPAAEVTLRAALETNGVQPTAYTVKLFYP